MGDNAFVWTVFDLLINFMQGTFFAYFSSGCLGYKKDSKTNPLKFLLCSFLVFAAITISNYLSVYEGAAIFTYTLMLFLFSLAFLNGTVAQKFFVSVVPVNAMAVGSIFSTNLISFIVNKPIHVFMLESTVWRLITIAVSNLIFFSVIFIIKKITAKTAMRLKEGEWFLLGFDLVLSVVAYMFLYYSLYNSSSIKANFFIALCAVSIIVINITIYILLAKFSNRYKIEMENSLLRQQIDYQTEAIQETKKRYELLQKTKHDFRNTLCVIKSLNEDRKALEIDEYINEYLATQIKSLPLIDTGNNYVNAIINSKIAEAEDKNIQVTAVIDCDFKSDYNIDLCNLLGNLFDNAIRGCQDSKEKTITVDIRKESESTVITVKNSIDASVLEVNPELISDKPDKKNHGYGTRIIREIAGRYNGFADFYEENNYFCCNVVLYL